VLGHSRVDMTRRYTHVLADRQRVAADRMSDVLFGAQTAARPVRERQVSRPGVKPRVKPRLSSPGNWDKD
jgi:hypothetical protein